MDRLNTGLLLYIPYRWLENRVLEALRNAGHTDITTAQMKIVQRIGPDGTRPTDLAEQAQVTKQTAGFLVDQLEKAGWVEWVPDRGTRGPGSSGSPGRAREHCRSPPRRWPRSRPNGRRTSGSGT